MTMPLETERDSARTDGQYRNSRIPEIATLHVDSSIPKLRIVGDIALRSVVDQHVGAIQAMNDTAGVMPTVANLEGPVVDRDPDGDHPGVWSTSDALQRVSDSLSVLAYSIANNHIHDLGGDIGPTVGWATRSSRQVFGLQGQDSSAALLVTDRDGREWLLVGCGWPGSGCRRRLRRQDWRMLSPLDRELDDLLFAIRHRWPNAVLVVLPHWSYEFDDLPHPAFRACARRWAAIGVDHVVGSHPHTVGVYESFGTMTVAYSVGNAVFDRSQYFGGHLRTRPEEGNLGAVVLDHEARTAELYAARLNGAGARLAGPDLDSWQSWYRSLLTPYDAWYRANRRHRRRGLPVFTEADGRVPIAVKEALVRTRARIVYGAHLLRSSR